MVALGKRVRDVVTGFVGKATARTEYLGGRVSVCVEAEMLDGKLSSEWFEEARLLHTADDHGDDRGVGFRAIQRALDDGTLRT